MLRGFRTDRRLLGLLQLYPAEHLLKSIMLIGRTVDRDKVTTTVEKEDEGSGRD